MQKYLPIFICLACFSHALSADGFDNALKNPKISGKLRYGHITLEPTGTGGNIQTGAAFGGEMKVTTQKVDNLQFTIASYFTEKAASYSGDPATGELNSDYFNSNGEGYAYLGEAYIRYSTKNGSISIGKQKLDNPFIKADDIRMFANTFNAMWLTMKIEKNLYFEAGQVNSWAGFDSGSSQEIFKPAGSNGVTAVGFRYDISNTSKGQTWHYSFDKQYSLIYSDISFQSKALELAAQLGNYSRKSSSNIEGIVIGVKASYSFDSVILSAAKNASISSGNKIIDPGLGLGGGNYYAAMDESTIGGLNNANAYIYSAEFIISDDFSIAIALGHFADKDKTINSDEQNVILNYDISSRLNFEFIHAVLKNKGAATDNFSRQSARLTLNF